MSDQRRPNGDVSMTTGSQRGSAPTADVVHRAIAGDRRAVGDLLGYVRPYLVRYCRARIGDKASADDVAQEACVGLLTSLSRFRSDGSSFLGFAYGVASKKVADFYRQVGRDRAVAVADPPETSDPGGDPMFAYLADEQSKRLGQLLKSLTSRERDIIVHRVVLGMTSQETAEILGTTATVVRVAQHRALAKLRTRLSASRSLVSA